MYESFLLEVNDLNEALREINELGKKIISVTHISDSAQLLLVVETGGRKSVLKPVRRENEEIEEEGD